MPVKDEVVVSSTTDSDEEVNRVAGNEEEEEDQEESKESKEEGEKEEKEESEESKEESKDDEEEKKGSAEKEESEEEEADWSKARKKMKRRIDKLTARLKELEDKEPEDEEEDSEEEEPEVVIAEDRPRRKDFKTTEEYEDAITDWRIDQREAKKAIDAAAADRDRELRVYNSHLSAFEDTVDDLDEVRSKVKTANIEIPEGVQVAIIQMDRPDIAYELAKNNLDLVKDMVEVNKKSPTMAVAMLGRFIAKFDGQKEEKKPAKKAEKTAVKAKTESDIVKEVEAEVKKTVKPPGAKVPLTVVKGGSGTKTQTKRLDDEEVDYREYRRRREAGES
jgi:hypothetical protein